MQNTFDAGCKPSEAIDITVTSLSVFIRLLFIYVGVP